MNKAMEGHHSDEFIAIDYIYYEAKGDSASRYYILNIICACDSWLSTAVAC